MGAKKGRPISLRMPEDLLRQVDERARALGVTRTCYVNAVLYYEMKIGMKMEPVKEM
jgi:predicted DNA binding CopG/RHH family protein